ncbi:MAG: hypothetical protein R2852_08120 [Bacteroidia bacterium]
MQSKRQFLPSSFKISSWDELKPFFQELLDRRIESKEAFNGFLHNLSELESVVNEDVAWRYIKMTCDTTNKELEASYIDFVTNIQPQIAPFEDQLNRKIYDSPFKSDLESEKAYFIYFRAIQNSIQLFREENIELQAELQTLSQKYGNITGAYVCGDKRRNTHFTTSIQSFKIDRSLASKTNLRNY